MLRQQDARRLRGVRREDPRQRCPSARKHNHIFSIVDSLAVQEPRDKTDMYAILAQRGRKRSAARHDGARLGPAGRPRRACSRGCKLLRQRGHDVLVFHVMDDEELDFPFTGPTRFEGLEIAGLS